MAIVKLVIRIPMKSWNTNEALAAFIKSQKWEAKTVKGAAILTPKTDLVWRNGVQVPMFQMPWDVFSNTGAKVCLNVAERGGRIPHSTGNAVIVAGEQGEKLSPYALATVPNGKQAYFSCSYNIITVLADFDPRQAMSFELDHHAINSESDAASKSDFYWQVSKNWWEGNKVADLPQNFAQLKPVVECAERKALTVNCKYALYHLPLVH